MQYFLLCKQQGNIFILSAVDDLCGGQSIFYATEEIQQIYSRGETLNLQVESSG